MFYHGVDIAVSNKHLQEHVYTNELCNAFALYFKRPLFAKIVKGFLSLP